MTGDLFEREEHEAALHAALAAVRTGRGGIALVTGEAGLGKSSLVRAFLARAAGQPRVLIGACDPLAAPRPLGPLIDAATEVDPELAHRLARGIPRAEAFAAALELIQPIGDATVFVLEDLHWADEATLDLFTFLGRRLDDRPVLILATFRSDEVDARHPLRTRLGELHGSVRLRLELRPLSLVGVAALAAPDDVDPGELYRATGGNPFFVTEVLAAGSFIMPASVRDAVLARSSRLSDTARTVLDTASIVPGRIDRWLLDAVAGETDVDVAVGLDECERRGLLETDDRGMVVFRHELARRAIEDALEPPRKRRMHARALMALRSMPGAADVSRLAHHAEAADAGAAVLEHAPAAARVARSIGANREAAAHLEAAVRYGHLLDERGQAELWMELGEIEAILTRWDEALEALERAAALFASVGDTERQALALVTCDRPLWGLGRQPAVAEYLTRAEALLGDDLGDDPAPSVAAAAVALCRSTMHMLAREPREAEAAGQRSMTLAAAVGADAVLAEAHIQSGISLCMAGDDLGLERVRRGIELAEEIGDDRLVSLGHRQIGSGYGELRRYDIAQPVLHDGIEFAAERELVSSLLYQQAWLARCELETGEWAAAGRLAEALLRNERCLGNTRLVVVVTLGWLRARRGDPDLTALLDEGLALARAANHVQRLWPIAACRAEAAWLRGQLDEELPLVEEILALARGLNYAPAIEELQHWLHLADGARRGDAFGARTPFGASAAGRHDLAAARWDELGCPYEASMARFFIGSNETLQQAYEGFVALGAEVMRVRVATAMRALGARVPRGAIEATRANPHGLTARELEVLALLPRGLTNAQIGTELFMSPKTAAHHVSKILTKLQVANRAEAAAVAERLELGAQ